MQPSAKPRQYIIDSTSKIGETITIAGWVSARRDHGKLIFLDVRDKTGLLQLVLHPQISADAHAAASEVRDEFVVQVTGEVQAREERLINPNLATGTVELAVKDLVIMSRAETLPFSLENTKAINEETRLKYRYLDLRSDRMTSNIRLRHKVKKLARDFLDEAGFVEIETPLLTQTAPEGARDFLVPSRLQPGKFYALPQSPQQYKQLLMIAGFERYYQIAKCLRDEDLRGDRQPEHTQIDMEMSFMTEQEVRDLTEAMMIHIAEACGKKILQKPFPVFTHEEAMEKFGQDKFDLREEKDPDTLAFAWVVDFPLFEWDETAHRHTFAHNPFSAPKAEHVEKLLKGEDLEHLRAQQYDLVCNGFELASGGVRISDPAIQRKVFEIMGLTEEETEKRFGHLIRAYEYGAPNHAGIAPGLDRFCMLLANEENIREVIAFPVTSSGTTAVMEAPSDASEKHLQELHLKVTHDAPKRTTE
ncbi:MAG TPA: aspartate--tRNA ligase [Patescibacteria group bacterium]